MGEERRWYYNRAGADQEHLAVGAKNGPGELDVSVMRWVMRKRVALDGSDRCRRPAASAGWWLRKIGVEHCQALCVMGACPTWAAEHSGADKPSPRGA